MHELNYQSVQVSARGVHPNALLNSGKFAKGTRTLQFKQKNKCSLDLVMTGHNYGAVYVENAA